jgi:DinB superfamily
MPDNTNLRSSLEQVLIDLFAGKGAHANPIACVEDLSTDVASRRPDGHPRSVWELVVHLNFWMNYDLKRIDGVPPAYPEHAEESWPSIADPDSAPAWADAIARFRALILRHESLSRSPIELLSRPVPPGAQETLRAGLLRACHPDTKHRAQ